MRIRFSRFFILLSATAAITASSFAEDLDSALEAQKKKARHRTYSDHVLIDDQKIAVPHTQTEKEKDLDDKLRDLDAKMDARPTPAMQPGPAQQQPASATAQPLENQNWLAAAIKDNGAATALTNEAENAWVAQEMERRQGLKAEEAALAKENEKAKKILSEKPKHQSSYTELDRLKQYQIDPQKTIGGIGKDKDPDAPSYMTPRSEQLDPLVAIRLTPKKEIPVAPPLFSPEAARISALKKDPLRSTKSPALSPGLNPYLNSPSSPAQSDFSLNPKASKPAPLTPMQIIRKSSPINRPDPFAEDNMPKIKKSIWE